MRKAFAVILAAALVPSGLVAAAARKKTSTPKKTGTTAKKSTAPAKKSTSPAKKSTASTKKKTSTAKRSSSSRSRRKTTTSSWRTRQLQPTADRYKDIQQALIDKGHLQGPATGKWGKDSIDALRRFQQEQNLEASGKIDSLSLIALGLGPKYDTAAVSAAPPPVPR